MKIQAEVQVSRLEDKDVIFSCGSALNEEYAKEIGNPYSRRFDEYKQVFDNEVENVSNEYTLRIRKKGYHLDDVWEKCEQYYKKFIDSWHDIGYEEEELWRSGDEKTDYEPPFVDVKTFKLSEDAGTNDDDDVDEYFLVDEENEIVEPDVDVHLFGIRIDLPFDNIGVTNLVSGNVLEGEDMDGINADGFDSDPGNDDETINYRRRRLAELSTEMEEAKDKVYLHSIESRRNLKLYKNDSVTIRARCDGKVYVFRMSQGTGPTGLNRRMEAGPSGSSGPSTRSKKRKNTGNNDDSQVSSSVLDVHDKGDLCP
ncbi:hypothetical protein Tco_0538652 [Tanacetum coccineum]